MRKFHCVLLVFFFYYEFRKQNFTTELLLTSYGFVDFFFFRNVTMLLSGSKIRKLQWRLKD